MSVCHGRYLKMISGTNNEKKKQNLCYSNEANNFDFLRLFCLMRFQFSSCVLLDCWCWFVFFFLHKSVFDVRVLKLFSSLSSFATFHVQHLHRSFNYVQKYLRVEVIFLRQVLPRATKSACAQNVCDTSKIFRHFF